MDLSFSEIVVICAIAFLVFGPEEFVRRSHELGRFIGKLKTQAMNWKVMAEEELMKKQDPKLNTNENIEPHEKSSHES